MKIADLFGRKPRLDPLRLMAAAAAIHAALAALESYLEAKGDKRAQVLVRALHAALESAWNDHAPAFGIVQPLSGGVKPPAN